MVNSEIASTKIIRNENKMCGLTRGNIIFLKTFFLPDSLPESIRFLSMFLRPREMISIAIGKNDNERKITRVIGLYMSSPKFGKIMSEKVPRFPRNPSQEKARMYGGIKNGRKSKSLRKFLYASFVHSRIIANTSPIETDSIAVETPISMLLRSIELILESKENLM
ncbi:MAG: hypothetical protein A2Y81_03465 [Nitrospirae bacterium RBG_13_43_8]|nr:MAG: hypothetical protein A2Y81_03465 [Nitrospirae bacterium RBG_13_43_8]